MLYKASISWCIYTGLSLGFLFPGHVVSVVCTLTQRFTRQQTGACRLFFLLDARKGGKQKQMALMDEFNSIYFLISFSLLILTSPPQLYIVLFTYRQ